MHPWLSEPRILFWPMSLALLIDMALHEFPDQDSARFRGESHWRGLVRSQEALVLRPFCEKCIQVIKDTREENRTLGRSILCRLAVWILIDCETSIPTSIVQGLHTNGSG